MFLHAVCSRASWCRHPASRGSQWRSEKVYQEGQRSRSRWLWRSTTIGPVAKERSVTPKNFDIGAKPVYPSSLVTLQL